MSTPSQPDDDETPGGRTRTAGSDAGATAGNGGGSDAEATVVGHAPVTGGDGAGGPASAPAGTGDPRGGDQRPGPGGGAGAPGSGPSTGSTPTAGGAGTPPPWARRGAAGNTGQGPGTGRPSGPAGPSTGSAPAAASTGAAAARTGGPASGASAGGPAGFRGEAPGRGTGPGRGGGTAMIDAPTNQLSPEQLGMRRGPGRPAGEADGPQDDEAAEPAPPSRSGKSKTPRRASLQVKRFDPWSVLKLALVLGVALFFVWMFAVGVLYAVLDGMGVWAQLNGTYQDLTSNSGGGSQLITAGGVFGVAAIIGVINTILFTALASVSAFIYNISADVAGGIEVTLSERD